MLDVDPRHGADASLKESECTHGPIGDTVEVLTGGGGRHLYFAHPGEMLHNRITQHSEMQRNEFAIEFATAADVYEIRHLSKTYIEINLGWQYTPQKIKAFIRNRTKNVVVARKDDELAGFGIMTYMEESANLDLLAVKTKFRRQGIGRQLVAWLKEVARTAGITYLYVQVRQKNQDAIQFYKLIGFQPIDEKNGYYRGQETGVIMCKGLREIIRTF